MDTVTYPDTRVAQFVAARFIPARVPVKQNPRVAEEYLVGWTPNVVIADEQGKVHYRVEGYLPPEDFVANMALGVGKYLLNRKQFAHAKERFEEVSRRHRGTAAGAEAIYWLGVAQYKLSHDPAQLHQNWQWLGQEYAESEWTKRTRIPGRG